MTQYLKKKSEIIYFYLFIYNNPSQVSPPVTHCSITLTYDGNGYGLETGFQFNYIFCILLKSKLLFWSPKNDRHKITKFKN